MPDIEDATPERTPPTLQVLVADDDPVSRQIVQGALQKWGYPVVVASDGNEAWQVLAGPSSPQMVLLDWMMPGIDGLTICRRLRAIPEGRSKYLILVTARTDRLDLIAGLEAGANDYVTKPFHHSELRARLGVGVRMLDLQNSLADRVRDLESALKQVKQLRGLLPICMYCKRIRNDGDYWQQVETYISEHTEAEFSHGICPACYAKILKAQIE